TGRAGVDGMTVRIDDEAEPADIVFSNRDEEAALLGASIAFPAWRGDAFHKTLYLFRCDCRNYDPVVGMLGLEGAAILCMRFTWCKVRASDRLARIGNAVLHVALGMATLKRCEEMREGEGDDCPFGILFVPSTGGTQQRRNFAVPFRRELEPA